MCIAHTSQEEEFTGKWEFIHSSLSDTRSFMFCGSERTWNLFFLLPKMAYQEGCTCLDLHGIYATLIMEFNHISTSESIVLGTECEMFCWVFLGCWFWFWVFVVFVF